MPPLTLWLVDRSRVEAGLEHCRRARYLRYHAGPHGYGWDRKAQSIPAVTGQLIHTPLAGLHTWMAEFDALPSDQRVHAAIHAGIAEYQQIIDQRGLRLIFGEADLVAQTHEQLALLEGLVWTWARVGLPAFHVEHRIVEVEREDVTVLGCTCGLGDKIGTPEDHDARHCSGVGWMTRGDVIAQHRVTGAYSYHEFKTTADAGMNWEAQWAYRTQMLAGVLGAEARLGVMIDAVYVHGLIKGKRLSEYSQETRSYSGPKYQQSPLVYAYRRPANPPLLPEDWAAKHSYVDDLGKSRKLGKDYQRTGVWEVPAEIWSEGSDCLSPLDYWTRLLLNEGTLAGCYRQVGPIYRAGWKLESFAAQLIAEEARWRNNLWTLYEAQSSPPIKYLAPLDFGHPYVQAELDELFPQTRGQACRSYFGDTCAFEPVCEHTPGWEDLARMGYLPRRPHHQPELDQAIGRGLLPPDAGAAEAGDE